jgi:hypothetical protein
VQPQPHVVARGQYRVRLRGKAGQQAGQLSGRVWRRQLVEVIDNQRHAAAGVRELRQHPVDHRLRVEVRCRGWEGRATVRAGDVADRVEQGQPELLGVLLVALHPQQGELARLALTSDPGAQQRRLPAASRRRDDRHLPRRRAIQRRDKIAPVDQPGSCWSRHQNPALDICTRRRWRRARGPGTSCVGTRPARVLSTAGGPRSCRTPSGTDDFRAGAESVLP